MKTITTIYAVIILMVNTSNCQTSKFSQTAIHQDEIDYKIFLSFSLGMSLQFFNKNDSELLREDKRGNLNFAGELLGNTDLIFTKNKNLFSLGFSSISHQYTINNKSLIGDLFGTPDLPFRTIDYKNTHNSFQVGIGRLTKYNKKPNKISYFRCIMAVEKITRKNVKVEYYSTSTPTEITSMNQLAPTFPTDEFLTKMIFNFGTRYNLKNSGLGLSFDWNIQKTVTKINKEFGGRPIGIGIQLGITHQFK